jgi:hypothetical protein
VYWSEFQAPSAVVTAEAAFGSVIAGSSGPPSWRYWRAILDHHFLEGRARHYKPPPMKGIALKAGGAGAAAAAPVAAVIATTVAQ